MKSCRPCHVRDVTKYVPASLLRRLGTAMASAAKAALLLRFSARLKPCPYKCPQPRLHSKFVKAAITNGQMASAAKAALLLRFSARLKPCPYKGPYPRRHSKIVKAAITIVRMIRTAVRPISHRVSLRLDSSKRCIALRFSFSASSKRRVISKSSMRRFWSLASVSH